jgi:polyhydroxybutyrate depolymerase
MIGTDSRPARVVPPDDYDATLPTPVMFLLHGYTASAEVQDFYFGMSAITRTRGIILVLPDGTVDRGGNQFWNADQRCCDFGRTGVDDVGYLSSLLDQVEAAYNVDTDRVYFYGHSNGGYMSYRMACDLGDRITAIASLAGATRTNDADCDRSRPVSVLQIHGTVDPTIEFMSGSDGHVGAVDGVERWAMYAGCDLDMARMGEPRDFDTGIRGMETTVRVYDSDCASGFVGEVWAIQGGGHVPMVRRPSTTQVVDWLLARSPVTTL